jgi:dienelactone hydrolase
MTMRSLSAFIAAMAAALASGSALPAVAQAPPGQYAAAPVTFPNGGIELRGVLARPSGEGTFPAYIHNHGSMTFVEAARPPWTRLETGSHLELLSQQGYVALLVARRGHRGSEGTTQTYTIQYPRNTFVTASEVLQAAKTEAGDLVSAFEYVRALPYVDPGRIAIGGHSMGGFIAILAASREPRIGAVVSLAGGFTWKENNKDTGWWPLVERAWREAAKRITAPVLIMWSKNDYNLDPDTGRELEKSLKREGHPVQFVLYPPFEDNGHFLFIRPRGYPLFTPDLLTFLNANLMGGGAR